MKPLRNPAILAALAAVALLAASLAAGAAAPVGRYTITTNTVLDNQTGLRWQRTLSSSTYTAAQATAYCTALSADGFTNWRIPEMRELLSIVDITNTSPVIDRVAFPNTPSAVFWSATIYAPDTQFAPPNYYQTIAFDYGTSDFYMETSSNNVRCVR